MAKHTPGPWEAFDLTGTPVNDHPSVMSAKHCVATVWINDISRKRATANAILIAAAPEMLAVLNLALVSLEKDGPASAAAVLNTHGRAAIAKAEGRS